MSRLLHASVCVFLVCSTASYATEVLTWPACVSLALKNNSELLSARKKAESIEELEGAARSGFFPTVNGTLSYSRGDQAPGNHYSATLNGTQNLFNGLQDQGKV